MHMGLTSPLISALGFLPAWLCEQMLKVFGVCAHIGSSRAIPDTLVFHMKRKENLKPFFFQREKAEGLCRTPQTDHTPQNNTCGF